jgi:hypothetical protein
VRRFNPFKLFNGYFISVVFHLLLFLFFAFYFLKPYTPEKWYSFEWESSQENKVKKTSSLRIEDLIGGKNAAGSAGISKSQESSGNMSLNLNKLTPERAGESESVITMPLNVPNQEENKANIPSSFTRNRGAHSLKEIPGTFQKTNPNFSATLEEGGGEAYIISQSKPQIIPTEEGEVYIEFKLMRNGAIDMNSVNILSFTNAAYVESIRKVMPSWKFGFKGVYNPKTTYRLLCRFVINE